MDNEEFEIANDDDDDFPSNDNCSDEDGHDDARNLIDTRKEDFAGMKVLNTVQSHKEHSYFKVTINDDTKYMHKRTVCWLLTDEKSKISNDRLLRVQQTNKKN
jgi:hypothetical protein